MANYKEVDETLDLVHDHATTEQIQALLRTQKGHENVKITADNKKLVVYRNLRDAVESRAIDIEKVFDLIRDSEENGQQHIFYYKPKTRTIANALTFDSIAKQLFGKDWETKLQNFPAIKQRPNTYQRSDFRKLLKKPTDWILKVYGHTVVTRFTGKTEERQANHFWREYVAEDLRIVLMARWNAPDLLEIRVQRNESRRRVEEWHNKMWEMLGPAVVRRQFDPWELSKGIANLISEQRNNKDIYSFRDASVIDKSGVHATFQMYEDQGGDLFASIETRDSIEGYLSAKSDFKGLTVTWEKQKSGTPQKDLRVFLAARERHETVAGAHSSREDLDYVTNQLRRFNK